MLRITCKETDSTAMIHTGAQLEKRHVFFDVDLPEVERWLMKYAGKKCHSYNLRTVESVQVLEALNENGK